MSEKAAVPRIVVGVDGSVPSLAALRWAVREAELINGVVDAVTAWQYPFAWYGWTPPTSEVFDFAKTSGKVLAEAVDKAVGPDPPVEIRTQVIQGKAAAVLLDAAHGARLLVVGDLGHGGLAEALLGSVGHHCVQHAPCPVVVVRGTEDADAGLRRTG